MKNLNIFLDESGTNEFIYNLPYDKDRYFIITMLFHEEENDISDSLAFLEKRIEPFGYKNRKLHFMPLLDRETDFEKSFSKEEVKRIFNIVRFSLNKFPVCVNPIYMDKRKNNISIRDYFEANISFLLESHYSYFQSFDKIEIIYDNGQKDVKAALQYALHDHKIQFITKTEAGKYRLAQICDYVCTVQLLELKRRDGTLNPSHKHYFNAKEIKDMYKDLTKKFFNS